MKSDIIDVIGEIVAETDNAYRFDDGGNIVWLPKRYVEWDPVDKSMAMPEWLAKDKGLI
jgi:hypothetical protein